MTYSGCINTSLYANYQVQNSKIYKVQFTVSGMNTANGDFIRSRGDSIDHTFTTNGVHTYTFVGVGDG